MKGDSGDNQQQQTYSHPSPPIRRGHSTSSSNNSPNSVLTHSNRNTNNNYVRHASHNGNDGGRSSSASEQSHRHYPAPPPVPPPRRNESDSNYGRRASHNGSSGGRSSSLVVAPSHRHYPAPPSRRKSIDTPPPYHGNGSISIGGRSTTKTSSSRPVPPPPPPRRRVHSSFIVSSRHGPPSSSPRKEGETPLRNAARSSSANSIGSRVNNAQRSSKLNESLSGNRPIISYRSSQPPSPLPRKQHETHLPPARKNSSASSSSSVLSNVNRSLDEKSIRSSSSLSRSSSSFLSSSPKATPSCGRKIATRTSIDFDPPPKCTSSHVRPRSCSVGPPSVRASGAKAHLVMTTRLHESRGSTRSCSVGPRARSAGLSYVTSSFTENLVAADSAQYKVKLTRSRSVDPPSIRVGTIARSVDPPSVARFSKKVREVNDTKARLDRVDSICSQIRKQLDELDAKNSQVREDRSLVESSGHVDTDSVSGTLGNSRGSRSSSALANRYAPKPNSPNSPTLARENDNGGTVNNHKGSQNNKQVTSSHAPTVTGRSKSSSRSRSITYRNSIELNTSLTKILKRLSSTSKEVTLASESTKSSTASLSTPESSDDCDNSPIVSVMRSFQNSSSGANEGAGRGKGRRSHSVERRRAPSLSRHAVRALSTSDETASSLDSSSSPNKSKSKNQLMERDDSKASMVYDVPFDPITGRCNYHPTVCMAVKNEEKSDKGVVAVGHHGRVRQSSTTAVVLGGWKIVRTTCPKCMYNY